MRRFATFNLFYLAFVAASALTNVHIDHQGSHEAVCPATEISASCHADVAHEHEATHPGQESLFEHTFENGSFEELTQLTAPPFLAMGVVTFTVPFRFRALIEYDEDLAPDTSLFSQIKFSAQSSRAPPVG